MTYQGIKLRRVSRDDSVSLYEAARESVHEVNPWLPWCHHAYTLEEAEQWTEASPCLFDEGVAYRFVITDEGENYLGGCGLNQINPIHGFANLGIGCGVPPRGVEWQPRPLVRSFVLLLSRPNSHGSKSSVPLVTR
jgi:RimJ/RimL family protein N-acetyltransferase